MAEENQNKIQETVDAAQVETQDRGLFGFGGKKCEEKTQEEVIAGELEKVKISETQVEESKHDSGEKKHSLLEKLHRSDSSSSSSSDEEEVGGEKKKKKKEKKGLKAKIKEKISGEKEEGKHKEDTAVPVEKCDAEPAVHHDAAAINPEEKKGFLEKIKEKLPGQHKKPEEAPVSSEHASGEAVAEEKESKEKKGLLEKIKEKLPGYHPSKTEEEKEKKDDAIH